MEKKKPLISVIMPCYNHEKYVATAIESVLNQTYNEIELIVADNGCTDSSYDVIKQYADRINIIRLEKNDLVLCTDLLLAAANGEYIAIMTSDDCWMPEKIEKQMDIIDKRSDVFVCSTWAYSGDEELRYDENETNIFMQKNRTRGEWLKRFVTKGNCIAYPSVLMKKESYVCLHEKMESGYRQLGDLFLWLYCLFEGSIYVIEEPLMIFRWHTSDENCNMSSPSEENQIRDGNEIASIIEYAFENMPNDLFIEAFGDEFVNSEASTKEEILCEKLFVLRKEAEKKTMYQSVYLNFYYRHYLEIEKLSKEKYNFTRNDFWNDSGKMGTAFAWKLWENECKKNADCYNRGVKNALMAVYGDDTNSIKKVLLQLLPENEKNAFIIIGQNITTVTNLMKARALSETNEYNYWDILRAALELAKNVQNVYDKWEYFCIEINLDGWKKFVELLMKAASTVIDLNESILPYLEWLTEQFLFCL